MPSGAAWLIVRDRLAEFERSREDMKKRALDNTRILCAVRVLGANVRHHRKLKGMSQERLALDAGMERSYVSDLERGIRNPSVRALGRIADALGIEPKLLLELPGGGPSI